MRSKDLLEKRAALEKALDVACEAGNADAFDAAEKELNANDADMKVAQAQELKIAEARARGQQIASELRKPTTSAVVDQAVAGSTTEERGIVTSVREPGAELRRQGDFLVNVRAAAYSPSVRERMEREQRAATGAGEVIPADAGFLVTKEIFPDLWQKTYDTGEILKYIKPMPIGPNASGLKVNQVDETSRAEGSRFGGLLGYWVGEGTAPTASKPKFRQMELILQKLAAAYYATDEILQDSVGFAAQINQMVPMELAFRLEDAIVNGDGQAKPLGIANSRNNALQSVAIETGQTLADKALCSENIVKMWARMWPACRKSAVWLINPELEPWIQRMGLAVGVGGMLTYLPPGGLSASPYGALMGRPLIPCEYCAAPGTLNDIVFCDLSPASYMVIDKGGITGASSIHVNFLQDEQVFRFLHRVQGQPTWSAGLTPKNGTSGVKYSPYIALAARS